ncbi:MAG: hypothetical protein JW728_01560 [Candidatus Aureabacteria bacterium]|nr:hypothetical protein [Candidatus Auribacterota bacterium]
MNRKTTDFIFFALCIAVNLYIRCVPSHMPQPGGNIPGQLSIRDDRGGIAEENYKYLLKDRIGADGNRYFFDVDSYQYLLRTKNVLVNGFPGDMKKDAAAYDCFTLAPVGNKISNAQLLFYSSAFCFKICALFSENLSLQNFLFFMPVFYSLVFVAVVYFAARTFYSPVGSFLTGIYIGLNEALVVRTSAGWYDYDAINLILPFSSVWFFYLSIRNRDNNLKSRSFALASALMIGLFAFSWSGWWFPLLIIVFYGFLLIANNVFISRRDSIKRNKDNIKTGFLLTIVVSAGFASAFLLTGSNPLYLIANSLRETIGLAIPMNTAFYPSVFYTVSELGKTGALDVINLSGGILGVMLSFAGFLMLLKEKKNDRSFDFFLLLFLWLLFMWFASLSAVRFVVFLVVALGFFFGFFAEKVAGLCFRNRRIAENFIWMTAAFLTLVVAAGTVVRAYGAVTKVYPCVNAELQETLLWVKNRTESDAIINCWWDYGDLYKAVSERRVIFDGQNQNDIVAYWFARALLSEEEEARNILRMLNNASYRAYKEIDSITEDAFESYIILNDLIKADIGMRKRILSDRGFKSEDAENILNYLNEKPCSAYLVLEKSLLVKIPFISYIGNWNFERLYVIRNNGKENKDLLSYLVENFKMPVDKAEAEITGVKDGSIGKGYDELSQPCLVYSTPAKGTEKDGIVFFENGLVYNVKARQAKLYNGAKCGYTVPGLVVVSEEGRKTRLPGYMGSSDRKAYWIYREGGDYFSVVLDEPLIDTLFSEAMFLGGNNLRYFKKVYYDRRNGICIYRIKW